MSLEANDAVVDTVEGAPSSQQNVQSSSWMLDGQDGDGNAQEHSSPPSGSDHEDAEPRGNRFPGSASTWRHYTAEERALAASLDQLRAEDLSVHLYNAHALKARLYSAEPADNARPWMSKRAWMQRNENGDVDWHPDQHWTAWPMPAEDVPRPHEEIDERTDEDGVQSLAGATNSAEDLYGELLAAMLRGAKDQFARRTWTISDARMEEAAAQDKVERPRQAEEPHSSADGPAPQSRYDGLQSTADVPLFSADDEAARALLHPAISQVMSKLDNLLMALHRSRLGHVKSRHTEIDNNDRIKTHKRKRRDTAEAEEASPESLDSPTSGGDSQAAKGRTSSKPSGKHALRCRDWSEVLGFAGLTGWDPAVLDRTAARCSKLLGEEMTFRVMPETSVSAFADREVQYRPELVPELDAETDLEDDSNDPAARHSYTCPVPTCARHDDAYELRWRLHEHLRKKHGYSRDEVEDLHIPSRPTSSQEAHTMSGTSESTPDTIENESLMGGAHVDGFMLPVTARLNRGKDRSPRRKRGASTASAATKPQSSKRTTTTSDG
ncbi:N-terminal acetyltransferase [Oleoguttula sp. CCFEE 5521]